VDRRFSVASLSTRRRFLGTAGAATLVPVTALAENMVKLPLPGGPDERAITTAFPQKGALILQRTRPPLLETPLEVFVRLKELSWCGHMGVGHDSVSFGPRTRSPMLMAASRPAGHCLALTFS
jgi:hypothetical protein